MYKCGKCGWHFEEDEALRIIERYGDCHGIPAAEYTYFCPLCHSDDISNAGRCAVCGKWKSADDLNSSGVCSDCMKEPEEALFAVLEKHKQCKDELRKFERRCLMLERNAISLARCDYE